MASDHEHHHPPGHAPGGDHDQHERRSSLLRMLAPHRHDHQIAALDPALATERGLQAVKVSFAALLLTALFQIVVVLLSGSTALLADTIHNFSDALTAVPLGLAFTLARRAPNSRYTYGYGRAEDIAGAVIVVMILFSAGEAIYQSVIRILRPQPVGHLVWVAVAALIGFAGNELIAAYRIRVGQEIGSAALVADGRHARTDGFTSLAVLAGVIGIALGFPMLDPIIALLIGAAILFIVWDAAQDIYFRIMDAVDPHITALVERTAALGPGVMAVHDVTIRWVGHRQRAELHIIVNCQLTTCDSHSIAETVRHRLLEALAALVDVIVHVDPCECANCEGTHATMQRPLRAPAS